MTGKQRFTALREREADKGLRRGMGIGIGNGNYQRVSNAALANAALVL